MAWAIGVLHMPLAEWQTLTPDEWQAVCRAWADHAEALQHDKWERMRLLATISVQPHVKGRITPATLLPLPWDTKARGKTKPRPHLNPQRRRHGRGLLRWWRGWANNRCSPSTMA